MDLATRELPQRRLQPERLSWVVGSLVGASLAPVVERLCQVQGLELQLQALPSPYWGCDQVVTGLLTGQDLLDGLQGRDLGERVLIPSVMLRQGQPVFLDDLTLEEVEQRLGCPLQVVGGAAEVVAACLCEAESDV